MSAKSRLLDQVREAARVRHYSYRTEQQYVQWVRRYILFHDKRHPLDMGALEVEGFLSYLAVERQVAAATQAQALAAILFLYKHVLNTQLPWLSNVVRARRPKQLPLVLTREEVRRVLAQLHGDYALLAGLLYGSGLRLMEALRLRVKDVNLHNATLAVRDGKGNKDRITLLPRRLLDPLRNKLAKVRDRHREALASGFGGVEMPFALERKYSRAHLEIGWQYVFPASRPSRDPRSGAWRRHHIHEDSLQRRVKQAMRDAGIDKPASCHTFRHNRGGIAARSPLD